MTEPLDLVALSLLPSRLWRLAADAPGRFVLRSWSGGGAQTLRSDILGHAVDRFLANERVDPGIEVKRDQFARGFGSGHHAASSRRDRCGSGFAGAHRLSAQRIREQSATGVPDLKNGS